MGFKKKLVALALAVSSLLLQCNSAAYAEENPQAAKIRELFNSQNYYVEYDKNTQNGGDEYRKFLAHKINKIDSSKYLAQQNGRIIMGSVLAVRGDMFWVPTTETLFRPLYMREGSKYYQLMSKKLEGEYLGLLSADKNLDKDAALVLDAAEINGEKLDPAENWQYVVDSFRLPSTLNVFAWDNQMCEHRYGESKPEYVESTELTIDKKKYVCDIYSSSTV